jgi:hypothetical protein
MTPFQIVNGPSVKGIETCLTDPFPYGQPGTDNAVRFTIITAESEERTLPAGISMIRDPRNPNLRSDKAKTFLLILTVTPEQAADIFFSDRAARDEFLKLHWGQLRMEIWALYNTHDRTGMVALREEHHVLIAGAELK